ncbi:hypothetical protein [Streptomyces ipomoeae]|uniref:hypothetical protein n=1 Tax=Streptomyces ipomoeae TaxID=103232 RepID=UPI001146F3FE|nr:hypothetical protein [Streptomyces ipomoeae]TQE33184.1 hypothetical protein Sipo7851_22085 [Streptomyces ipomoeae]
MQIHAPSDAIRQQMRQWDQDFTTALSEAADAVPGLLFRIPPGQSLPALRWEADQRGAYWASAGLVHRGERASQLSQVAASLHYLRDPEDSEGPFERDEWPLQTLKIGTRDPRLVAARLVAAAQLHRATL